MAIPEKDLKILWGSAAGQCAYPGCGHDCISFLDADDPTVLGEMAHVMARSPAGPRGTATPGPDRYDNLILLCPTHHTLVDKASPGQFTSDDLWRWKREHEEQVRNRLRVPVYATLAQLAADVLLLLQENHGIWKTYGPESPIATRNPMSNNAQFWQLRKLSTIIPNNRRIINMFKAHGRLLTSDQHSVAVEFIEHAEGFEASAYDRRDSVPRFPAAFKEMIRSVAAG